MEFRHIQKCSQIKHGHHLYIKAEETAGSFTEQLNVRYSCCLGVTFRLKWVSPQYEDKSKTQWNMSDLHERHIKSLRSSNMQRSNIQRKSVTYWQADVTSTRKHVCNSFETWSLPSELKLRMTAGVKNIESSKNCLFFVFFHADISIKSHRGSSAPPISKHIWSSKVTWSKQHLALSVRISQFISTDKFTITESLFKIIHIYRLKNKDDKKNKKVKKMFVFLVISDEKLSV